MKEHKAHILNIGITMKLFIPIWIYIDQNGCLERMQQIDINHLLISYKLEYVTGVGIT